MKYYIIAGEASGDLHGSKLIQEIKKNDPESNFRLWGGDLMSKSGGKVVKNLDELSFMGCLLYTSPSPRDVVPSRMPSSA